MPHQQRTFKENALGNQINNGQLIEQKKAAYLRATKVHNVIKAYLAQLPAFVYLFKGMLFANINAIFSYLSQKRSGELYKRLHIHF